MARRPDVRPRYDQTWTFTATDATSAVTALCRVRSTCLHAAPSSPCSGATASHAISNLPDGSYTFEAFARDGGLLESPVHVAHVRDRRDPAGDDGDERPGRRLLVDGHDRRVRILGRPGRIHVPVPRLPRGAHAARVRIVLGGVGAHRDRLLAGAYSFEVRATDPYGNTDPSPAKRTFSRDGAGRRRHGHGHRDEHRRREHGHRRDDHGARHDHDDDHRHHDRHDTAFDPRITSLFFYKGTKTRFTRLVVTDLPKGAKVNASCKGKGCAFKSKSIRTAGAKLNVLKKLKRVRLRSGAVLQLKITAPTGELKLATWKIRTGKAPGDLLPLRAEGRQARPLRLIAAARGAAAKLAAP